MAAISASMVKELRDRTQAGMADCKNALVEADGDMEKAVEVILKKGIVKAASRAGRVAAEGEVATWVAPDGKRASSSRSIRRRTSCRGATTSRDSSRAWSKWPARRRRAATSAPTTAPAP